MDKSISVSDSDKGRLIMWLMIPEPKKALSIGAVIIIIIMSWRRIFVLCIGLTVFFLLVHIIYNLHEVVNTKAKPGGQHGD